MNISHLLSEEDYEYMERFYALNITSCNISLVTRDYREPGFSMENSLCKMEQLKVLLISHICTNEKGYQGNNEDKDHKKKKCKEMGRNYGQRKNMFLHWRKEEDIITKEC